jgi:hypothetical protein
MSNLKYLIKFSYEEQEYSCECEIESEDNWTGLDVNDDLAFDVNVFQHEEGEPMQVNVYKLDPQYKTADGKFTMDGNNELIHDNRTVNYFERN